MRKWCPDPFGSTPADPGRAFTAWPGAVVAAGGFTPRAPRVPDREPEPGPDVVPGTEAAEEAAEALRAMERECARRLEEARGEFRAGLAGWREEMEEIRRRDAHRLADAATELALAVAERMVRDAVAADRGVLVRTLETALFKIQASRPVTVVVHPADKTWLDAEPDLREELKIGAVTPDRRIQPGGCRIRTADAEWDATLESQLETLRQTVDGALRDIAEDPDGGR